MFGVSLPEIIVIFCVALIVLGPEKLPELARNLGKIMAQLRRSSDEMRREFYNSVYKPAKEIERSIEQSSRNLISQPIDSEKASQQKNEANLTSSEGDNGV